MERFFTISKAGQVFLFNGYAAAAFRDGVVIRVNVGRVIFQPHDYAVRDFDNNVSSRSPAEGYAVFRCLGSVISGPGISGAGVVRSILYGLSQDDFFK